MNAVVLASKDGQSAVLLKNGTIRNIPKEYKVGERIHVAPTQSAIARYASMAAAAIVLFVSGLFGYSYQNCSPCSYVTLDVNPSIEYTLNRRNEVIAVDALNSDAEPIVNSVNENINRKSSLDYAINNTLDALTANNYLNNADGNVLLFDVVSDNDKRSSKIINTINEIAYSNSSDDYHVISSSMREHQAAVQNNISAGRYAMMLEELGIDSTEADETSLNDFRSKSVREMVNSTVAPSNTDKTDIQVTAADDQTVEKAVDTDKTQKPATDRTQASTPASSPVPQQVVNDASAATVSATDTDVKSSEDSHVAEQPKAADTNTSKNKVATETGATETSKEAVEGSSEASSGGESETASSSGSDQGKSGGSDPGKSATTKPSASEGESEGGDSTSSSSASTEGSQPGDEEDQGSETGNTTPGSEEGKTDTGEESGTDPTTPATPATPATPVTPTEGQDQGTQDGGNGQTTTVPGTVVEPVECVVVEPEYLDEPEEDAETD